MRADAALTADMRMRLARMDADGQYRFLCEARFVSRESGRAAEVLAKELGLCLPTGVRLSELAPASERGATEEGRDG